MAYNLSLGTTALLVSGEFDYVLTAGNILYYADTPNVSAASNIGSLAVGQRLSRNNDSWIVSAGTSYVQQAAKTQPLAANGMGVVVHGSVAGVARPNSFAQYTWIGSVEPTNMTDSDTWIDTSG